MSMPRLTPVTKSSGEPTPSRCRGLSFGNSGVTWRSISHNIAFGSPTESPPTAIPANGMFPMTWAQFRLERSLHNTKKRLLRSIAILNSKGTLGPAVGALHPLPRLCRCAGICGADIQRQDNIRAECSLDPHDALRRQQVQRSIQVRLESRSLLAQFAQVAQAENLEAAAISQNGAVPVHKSMQPAKIADQLRARS